MLMILAIGRKSQKDWFFCVSAVDITPDTDTGCLVPASWAASMIAVYVINDIYQS